MGNLAVEHTIKYTPKYGGNIWYVDGINGNDANSGKEPEASFATIGAAISACSAGDKIIVHRATYTETGLDLNKDGVEMWFKLGAILQPPSGDALVISGSFCRVICENGALLVDPAGSGVTGVRVTGNFCYLAEIRVKCDSVAAIGFDIQGSGSSLRRCRCAAPTTAAFKIQGSRIRLETCCTGGNAGLNSKGFWMTNSCDKIRLNGCGSQGHEGGGYYVDSGCTNGAIENCYSGGGDGKWVDVDNTFVWSDFSYEREKYSVSTFTATGGVGGRGTNYNIFQIYGAVRIINLYGHVRTAMPNTNSTVKLDLYSTNGSVEITDAGPQLRNAVVGTILARLGPANDPLVMAQPNSTPALAENTTFNSPQVPVILVEDDSADTYVQVVLSAALASGSIHWHIEWEPLTSDGFIIPV